MDLRVDGFLEVLKILIENNVRKYRRFNIVSFVNTELNQMEK